RTGLQAKPTDQLARRAEVDTIKTQIDTLGALIADAQNKVDSVHALQHTLLPTTAQLLMLPAEVEKAFAKLKSIQHEDAVPEEQETRLTGMLETSREISV